MRELKFRVWDTERRTMLPVLTMMLPCPPSNPAISVYALTGELNGLPTGSYLRDGKIEIMQYTGLKDKNGREIYEGDIWKRGGFLGQVCFRYSAWWFERTDSSSWYEFPAFYSNAATGEVVGNRYENPELMGGKP